MQQLSALEVLKYYAKAIRYLFVKEFRAFVIIPLIINIFFLIFGSAALLYFIVDSAFYASFNDFFLQNNLVFLASFLKFIIVSLLSLSLLFSSIYFFTFFANIFAAPFYGILAQRAQLYFSGMQANDDGFAELIKDLPRIMLREVQKLIFIIPRFILILIITLIPFINIVSPILWFLFGACMMCIQYTDYAFDNNKISFANMKRDLKANNFASLTFGSLATLVLYIPLIKVFVPPVCVIAGTLYYIDTQKQRADIN